MTRQKNDLPTFVQPYRGGKYKVVIMRQHLKYTKSGFDTPQAARVHALEVLGQAADKAIAAQPGKILSALGYSCSGCGHSQSEPFFKCPKCNSQTVSQDAGPRSIDEIIAEHVTDTTPATVAAPVPSCGNCIHGGVCRLKHEYVGQLAGIFKQFYAKTDVPMIRQIIGAFCEFYGRKG